MRLMFDVDAVRVDDRAWRGRVIAWRGPTSRGWPHYTARTHGSSDDALEAALRLRDYLSAHPLEVCGPRGRR
jgi:hypothetical protein